MFENRNKQNSSPESPVLRQVASSVGSPSKDEIIEVLATEGNTCEYLALLNDEGLYAEVHKVGYNGEHCILKMIGHNSQMRGLIMDADEHAQAHRNLEDEVDILEQSGGVLPGLRAVVKNNQGKVVGFVAEFIDGTGLKTLAERGFDRDDMDTLLHKSIEAGRTHNLFFWDIRAENFIARERIDGLELVFVDAGGILRNDPGIRLQEAGIQSTLGELYGEVQ